MTKTEIPPETVYQLAQQAADRYGSHTAVTYIKSVLPDFIDERLSFSELFSKINRVIRMINDRAHCYGNRPPVVSFLLPNIPQTHYVLWGAESAGIANPLNPLLSEEALVALMEKAETDILIALGPNPASDIWEKSQAVVGRLNKTPLLLSVVFDSDENESLEQLLPAYSHEPIKGRDLPQANDIAAYFHTGGTTGSPKLAMQTHRNQMCTANLYRSTMRAGVNDVCINGLPMFHVAGALVLALGGLGVGVQSVLPTMAGFRNAEVIARYWEIVEHYKATIGGGIPTSVAAMVATPIAGADISRLRFMVTGGAPTPQGVIDAVQETVGCPLYQIYGMTETAGALAMPNLACDPVVGSAGHVSANVEIRIDREAGQSNAVGEIFARGPMVFPGYLGHEKSPLEDGWLRTGDLGYLDNNNNLFITGRAKDLIIRGGHNIDPAIIETCLESHAAVSMASAVGKPDAYAGELPVVFVQLNGGHKVSEDELIDYAREHIDERAACPKSVFIVESLPITAVGKVHKPTLRAGLVKMIVTEALCVCDVSVNTLVHEQKGIQTTVKLHSGSDHELRLICDNLQAELGFNIRVTR